MLNLKGTQTAIAQNKHNLSLSCHTIIWTCIKIITYMYFGYFKLHYRSLNTQIFTDAYALLLH